jgi:hypothetical protein
VISVYGLLKVIGLVGAVLAFFGIITILMGTKQ